jgi:hypothetical protein
VTARAIAVVAVALCAAACAGEPTVPPAAEAPAPAPARTGGVVLVPDGPGAVARATAPPGAEVVVRLRVANPSGEARVLALRSDAPWLAVAPSVGVPPRQSVAVPAVARVPIGARGALRGRVAARAEGDREAAVSVSYESALPVVVQVAGERR